MKDYWTRSNLDKVAATFDEKWYAATYLQDLKDLKQPDESVLDFYLRAGGRLGHDPHEEFSELFFRTLNPGVYQHLLSAPRDFGYLLFCGGFREKFRWKPKTPTPAQAENWRSLTRAVDRKFIATNNTIEQAKFISPLDYYIRRSREKPISPSPNFSEEHYRLSYSDVSEAVARGNIISGYHHYVVIGRYEDRHPLSVSEFEAQRALDEELERHAPGSADLRKQLEENVPGIGAAVEFGFFREIEYLTDPITIKRRDRGKRGFVVFMPYFFPEIFFGGYLAFFNLLKFIKQQQGGDLKLVIVRRVPSPGHLEANLNRIKKTSPDIAELFSSIHLLQENREIEVDGGYGVVSFCAETHFVASDAARQLGVRPIFIIQDYEPDFHPAGTLKTFVRSAFELPHIGIYNSKKLHEYFINFTNIAQVTDKDYRYATFENTIKPMALDWENFRERHQVRQKRQLIAYARPEFLGGRNEFAILLLALKRALRLGYFDEAKWSFHGVGSMRPYAPIILSASSQMQMMPKLPLEQYEEFIISGDIGISLISTPHPGIIHFQMANFGLASITYATRGRSPEWLQSQSKNIIPSIPTIDGLCDALGQAVELAGDLPRRYENALHSLAHTSTDDIEICAKFALTQGMPS